MVSAVEAHTRASSSAAMAWVTVSAPAPPYASGMPSAGSSISLQASKDFQGNSAFRSTSAAWGATFSSAKVRMVCAEIPLDVGQVEGRRAHPLIVADGRTARLRKPLLRWPPDGGRAAIEQPLGRHLGDPVRHPSSTSKA